MKDTVYLVFDESGIREMKKRSPALKQGEYAVCLNFEVPDAIFEDRFPEVDIQIPEESVSFPGINVSVQNKYQEVFGKLGQQLLEGKNS